MRIRIIFFNQKRLHAAKDPDLRFHGVALNGPPWSSFWCSLFIHVSGLWLFTSYVHFVAQLRNPLPDVRAARVLELSMDPAEEFRPMIPTLSLNSSNFSARSASFQVANANERSAKHQEDMAKISGHMAFGNRPTAPTVATKELRQFKMPPTRIWQPAAQILVQLDLPPTLNLHQDLRVPTLVVLTAISRTRVPPPFVAPPERNRLMEVPKLVRLQMRPPVLDIQPEYEQTREILEQLTPHLPVPVGAVAPTASSQEPMALKAAASTVTGRLSTESTTIISLPDRPIPAAPTIVLPLLNQVSEPVDFGAATPEDSNRDEAPNAMSKRTARKLAGDAGSEASRWAGDTVALNTANGLSSSSHLPGPDRSSFGRTGGIFNSDSQSAAGSESAMGFRSGTGESRDAVLNSSSRTNDTKGGSRAGTAHPVRVIRPRDGHYDLAIVQSSGAIPGISGLLKCQPVYSVYLSVGTGNEWLLQYCLPADKLAKPTHTAVVQIGTVTHVDAPYAFSIFRPVIQLRAGARYAFIHGFVGLSGRLERLNEAGEAMIENIDTVLESLQQWEFRPASQDGQPTAVEILLCIPNIA